MNPAPNFEMFWAEQEAFQARHADDARAARRAARKEELWQGRSSTYLRAYPKLAKQTGAIRVSEAHQREFFAEIAAKLEWISDAAFAAFDTHLGGLALDAARKWPVDTGLSRGALSLSFEAPAAGIFTGTVRSGAPYTAFIRPSGEKAARAKAKEEGKKYKAVKTPGWKMQFLVLVGGKWTFDADRYRTQQQATKANDPDRKPATNHPYSDMIRKPSKPALDAIAQDVLKVANEGRL